MFLYTVFVLRPGLKLGQVIRVILVNWLMFHPGQASLIQFTKYQGLTRILHEIMCNMKTAQWFQCFKMVFLEISNVPLGTVFAETVTYVACIFLKVVARYFLIDNNSGIMGCK